MVALLAVRGAALLMKKPIAVLGWLMLLGLASFAGLYCMAEIATSAGAPDRMSGWSNLVLVAVAWVLTAARGIRAIRRRDRS